MRFLLAAAVAAAVIFSQPAAAFAQDAQPLDIAIGDGATETIAGERVEYELILRNTQAEPVAPRVEVVFPDGLSVSSVDGGGELAEDRVVWRPTVAPGAEWTVALHGKVAVDVPFDKRIAVTACGYFDEGTVAAMCATDMNTAVVAPVGRVWVAWFVVLGLIAIAVAAEILRVRADRRESARPVADESPLDTAAR
ncbi:hypothetical protein AB0I28_00485 [Phytomonospora sp. NPDC050363]|uniref:hypothetical protein n=1 Tax=Phytomonospora sp. NPDC050363 TaxID=3155642 RepID=UPI0033FCAE5B